MMQAKSSWSAAAVASAVLLVNSTPAFASTQGSLGSTSTGSIGIQVSVPSRVRISGLTDVSFLNADPTVTASSAQNVCVWSNTSTRGYNITALGSGTGNAFTLGGTGLSAVPYNVAWSSSSGQSSGNALTAGTAATGLISAASSQNCGSGATSSASLVVSISSATLQTMSANANYTGTLTLVVAPE